MKIICIYFLLFLIYSILGWLLEVTCKLVSEKKFINRGFLIGPYCPIYGLGAILISTLLKKYLNDPLTLFIMMILICSILEYTTSFILEKMFKTRWWDYTNKRFNINGRICLETMIPFGILGFFIMYIINPFLIKIINLIPNIYLYILSIALFLIILLDFILSYKIMASLKNISNEIRADSTEKITKIVRKEIIRRNKILQKRLISAFPKLKVLYSKGLERKQQRMENRRKLLKKFFFKK